MLIVGPIHAACSIGSRAIRFQRTYVALKGNHEVLLETFLRDSSIGDYWRRLGGVETMHSYGISVSELMLGKGFEEARLALRVAVPKEHLRFLSDLNCESASNVDPPFEPVQLIDGQALC
jgi:hypothetical protein